MHKKDLSYAPFVGINPMEILNLGNRRHIRKQRTAQRNIDG